MTNTFKDLLDKYTLEDIVNYYTKVDGLTEKERAELEEDYTVFLANLAKKNPVYTGGVLIGISYDNGGKSDKEVVYYKLDDLKNHVASGSEIVGMHLEDVDKLDGAKASELCEDRILPPSRSYEYRPWSEVLGYEVDKDNVDEYGALQFIKDVFFKITFFGYDEEYIAEAREAIEITMSGIEELNELDEEEKKKRTFTPERATASFSFQDNRSQEEKMESVFESCRNVIRNKIVEFMTVTKIIKKRGL